MHGRRRYPRATMPHAVDALRHALAEVLTLDDLARASFPALEAATGASRTLLYAYDHAGAPRLVAGSLLTDAPAYTPALFAADPLHPYMRGVASGHLLLRPDPDVHGRVHRSPAYADFYRPVDADHYLGIWPTGRPYGSPGMFGVFLARSRRQGPFDDATLGALSGVEPELRAMSRRVARVAGLERDRALFAALGHAAGGVLVWDLGGALLHASDGVDELLRDVGVGPKALWSRLGRPFASRWRRGLAHEAPASAERVLTGPTTDAHVALSIRAGGVAEPVVAAVVSRAPHGLARVATLTPAERRVLALLATGARNRDLADRLDVSIDTVKTHVKRVLAKLGVRSRAEAALVGAALAHRGPASDHPLG